MAISEMMVDEGRKDGAGPLVGVSALFSLQCFDTDSWVTGRTPGLQ